MHPARTLFYIDGAFDDDLIDELRECVSVGNDREYEQDPRFGLIVLSEIASRALSPAVNDPGTAIEVLGSGLRVLLEFADAHHKAEEPKFRSVHAPEMDVKDLFKSFFNPIARDGAGVVEVQIRLIKVLEALALRSPKLFGNAAMLSADQAVEHSAAKISASHDKTEIVRRAQQMSARILSA